MTRHHAGRENVVEQREQRRSAGLPSGQGRAVLEGDVLFHAGGERAGRGWRVQGPGCRSDHRRGARRSSRHLLVVDSAGATVRFLLPRARGRRPAALLQRVLAFGTLRLDRLRAGAFSRHGRGSADGGRLPVEPRARRLGTDDRRPRRADPFFAPPHHRLHGPRRRPDAAFADVSGAGCIRRAHDPRPRLGSFSLAARRSRVGWAKSTVLGTA